MMNKSLYIIAPTRQSFIDWCEDNDYSINDKTLVHVRHALSLFGRNLISRDEIHYMHADRFDRKILKDIESQISIRSNYKGKQ